MTPAERARQIDKEEFEAECAAIRQRAYARFNIKPQPEKRVREWIKRVEPKRNIVPHAQIKRASNASRRIRASQAKLYEAFGQKRTLKEWAKETGMSPNTIRNRINLGWTIEDALTRKVQRHDEAKARAAVATQAGINIHTMRNRINRGWTVEQAVTHGVRSYRPRARNAVPKPEKPERITRAALARKAGLNVGTVSSRIRRGWPLELAVTEPPGVRIGRYAHGKPGVVSDFVPFEGTGAGSTVQETPNITFSREA